MLLDLEHKYQTGFLPEMSLIIGLARLGYNDETIRAGTLQQIKDFQWNTVGPPQCIIICSKPLHFAEKQALKTLWNVNDELTRDKQ
jgi:diphthamide biosynthesis methyltransferase